MRINAMFGICYTQFCEYLNHSIERKDITLLLLHKAEKKLQPDFAGKGLYIADKEDETKGKNSLPLVSK